MVGVAVVRESPVEAEMISSRLDIRTYRSISSFYPRFRQPVTTLPDIGTRHSFTLSDALESRYRTNLSIASSISKEFWMKEE